jgi:DnaJ-class molecular chaperone
MTHYSTLGVAENASPDEIKQAYRRLAKQHHPDMGGDTATFQRIQEAYNVLGDEQQRAQYDTERRGGNFRFTVNGHEFGGMPPDMEDILRNFGFSFGPGFANHGDPFAHMRQPRRNKDLQVDLVLDLASTLDAQTKTVSIQTTNGERVTVEVQIPKGVRTNNTIKYPKLGDNFFTSLERGDLYVRIHVKDDPRFIVDNLDLIKVFDLDCLNAIIGTDILVTGLDNKKFSITIPAGTQHGHKFRIPQQGLYAMNQNHRGSLIVSINLTVPTNLSSEQLELVKSITTTTKYGYATDQSRN